MYLPILGLGCGLLTLRFMPFLPSYEVLLLFGVSALILLAYECYKAKYYAHSFTNKNQLKYRLLRITVYLYVLGFGYSCFSAKLAIDDRLSPELDGKTLWITAKIADLPNVKQRSTSFILQNAHTNYYQLPSKIKVSWYHAPQVKTGEVWRLAVKLKRPRALLNPAIFDLEAHLTAQRIGAIGTVKIGERISSSTSNNIRDYLRDKLHAINPNGNILATLLVGDSSSLSSKQWQLLQATGTVHLMVISGTHISMLCILVYFLVKCLVKCRLVGNKSWIAIGCISAAISTISYGYIAGFGVPVQRALIMLFLGFMWRYRYSYISPLCALLIAFVVVLIVEPLSSLQTGFWLSFAAVFCLILMFTKRIYSVGKFKSLIYAQFAVTIGLLPLLVIFNLPVALSSALANFVAVPWVGMVIIPCALLGVVTLGIPFVGDTLLKFAGLSLDTLFGLLAQIAHYIPVWYAPIQPWYVLMFSVVGAFIMLSPVPFRALGMILFAGIFISPSNNIKQGFAQIWLLDVGQGLSVLVRTQNHTLLYDAASNINGFDRGERLVMPVLRAFNIKHLDTMLLSHADNDHAGGASFIKKNLPVKQVISGEPHRLPAILDAKICTHNQTWQWDGVTFRIIYPYTDKKRNQASCMLMIEAQGEKLFLTGDIDSYIENELIRLNIDIKTNWLLAPHHGSRSSSSANFLRATNASKVLISRGNHNAFSHPHQEVLERYKNANIEVFDSVKTGAQTINLGAKEPLFYMRKSNYFWREK